ncbi:MAG: phosphoglycerate dehydrogenase, partial [Actinomycetota bacterium]|nr:phosphoglycerate dehydrogenase [Actinomycetota bacterium]
PVAELLDAVAGFHALIVRSQTKVTADVFAAGRDLVVVGRAGIGLDNVDVESATRRGVMVVNAPQSNVISAAEHTLALLLAQARNLPQAHAALKAGQWARSRWQGVELHGKVLGVVGLGRVGALVAQRALAFGMRLVAYDPYVAPERARQMGVELMGLGELVKVADFLTIHLPRTPETVGLIDEKLLRQAKPGLRLVNTARGGIVDEEALAELIAEGVVAGAALDVFSTEPTTSSPLFELDPVVVTPHLGASTREAQDKAGETIADQVVLALAGEFVPYAVNVDASEASETVRPFLPLAERLGHLFAALCGTVSGLRGPNAAYGNVQVGYQGQLADYDTRILTLAVMKGLLAAVTTEPVSYVNAPQLATEAGLEVEETRVSEAHDYVNLVTIRAGEHAIAGTLFGLRDEARLVMIDDHTVDIPPARHMIVVRNDDRPGVIGMVGTVLGEVGVNISDMDVGRSPSGEAALMAISTDEPVPERVLAQLRVAPGIISVTRLTE